MVAGYISKDIESYGLLKLTAGGKTYLKKANSFSYCQDNGFEDE